MSRITGGFIGALFIGLMLLTSCGGSVEDSNVPDSTNDQSKITIGGDAEAGAYEFTLSDGTQCVYVDGYRNGGISCDWSK